MATTKWTKAGAGILLLWLTGGDAAAQVGADAASAGPSEALSGEEIYQKVLDNHLRSSYMEQRFISTDAGGDVQELHLWARFKDYRTEGRPAGDGTISKTSMKFTYPQDKRDAGYLFVEFHRRLNDGFNYSRKRQKVMRINTRKETMFGTDFSLEDLSMVRVMDDATYARQPDAVTQGALAYVIEVTYKPESIPQYAKSVMHIDPQTFVPLFTRHWDDTGVEVKTLEAPLERIEPHGDAYIPMEATMTDLRENTTSVLFTDTIEANIELEDRLFEPVRLAKNRR